jgi:pimeloyl-ACP methyl ester carboxylesterase
MLGLWMISAVLAFPHSEKGTDVTISPDSFRTWFNDAAAGRLTIPPEVAHNASRFRYVLVGGLHVGMMQGYLAQNAKALRARGVPDEVIHIFNPSSRKTVEENAESVRSELLAIAGLGPEKLVLIAHSRGACDTLAFALGNPRFVADRVQALFLVQGPFGGTGVADYVAGEGPRMDKSMPLGYRVLGKAIGGLEAQLLGQSRHQVISSLSHEASDHFWDGILGTNHKAIPIVSPKTFYVTSRTRPGRHPLLQRTTAWYLNAYYGPNDGLVTLEDQSLPELGTVLAVLDVGHTDLTHRFPSGRPKSRLRWALVDAIIMAVGTGPEPVAKRDSNLARTSRRAQRNAR